MTTAGKVASPIARWLQAVSLERAADRPARTLSRGMLQRLAIARTLLHQPSLVLLDEPYTGLDQAGVAMLSALIERERARGAIVLIVTHDLATVAPLCDQVLVLAKGRVGATLDLPFGSGTAESLLATYREAEQNVARARRGRELAPEKARSDSASEAQR
jgi:ABC-type multidrug transport system ATPase subunit